MSKTAHRRISKSRHTSSKRMTAEELRTKLKVKQMEARKVLNQRYPQVEQSLRDKGLDPAHLRKHSAKVIGTGLVTGSLLLSTPTAANTLHLNGANSIAQETIVNKDKHDVVVNSLKALLPEKTRPLERNEEKVIEQLFDQTMNVKAKATLEGEHLNTTYGRIGAEQHLRRYPGDTLEQHGEGDVIKEGMAPGLGAWGYFAKSKEELTPDLVETERWYAVVQTLYLNDWNTRQPYLKNWYKYRKVLIVNTDNGKAVVASIADSGPAAWTGKHYGGSPEVMDYLGGPRYKKGPVIVFFVDDPNNEVPLGPVEY